MKWKFVWKFEHELKMEWTEIKEWKFENEMKWKWNENEMKR